MKKLLLFSCMLVLVASMAYAQTPQIGLRAGANWATINDGEDAPGDADEPWRTGFLFGITSSFPLSEVFAVAPELIFVQKGYKLEISSFETKWLLNYLELPILFRLMFGDVLKAYVNAGPTVAYWLGGNIDDEEFDFDELDDENRLEIGGAVGGGVLLVTEVGTFLIDLRYTQGFTDIYDLDASDFDKFKNQSVSVSAIYLIGSSQ